MGGFETAWFWALLGSSERLSSGLGSLLAEVGSNNMEWTLGAMQEIGRVLRQADPLRRVNALSALLRCIETGSYTALLFGEVYALPGLAKAVDFLLQNRDFSSAASFFERSGFPANLPHLQNLSYNFLALTCQLLQTGAIVKPLPVYEGQEYEEPSLYAKWHTKLTTNKANLSIGSPQSRLQSDRARVAFVNWLGRWGEWSESLVDVFMEQLERQLTGEGGQLLLEMLQYGESAVTQETIARVADIVAYHLSFEVRTRALRLLDQLVHWGDVEALLVINFTENIESVFKAVWAVRGQRSLDEGRHIYPEIEGQEARKQEFYCLFLSCLQAWAVTFPTHEFLLPQPANNNDPAPAYHLYKLLREKKKTIFPPNPNLVRYETEARMAMLEKTLRNRLILREIHNQSQASVSIVVEHRLKDVQDYYDAHKEVLVNLISKKANPYEAMEKLADFQLHFEEMVESLSLDEDPGASLDRLIESGLELIEIVTLIHSPFLQLLHGEVSEKEFAERTTALCVNYFSPKEESHLVAFYSEKVATRKESLVEMLRLQKSDPLEKDLKYITNSIMVKQFRHKYRQKLEKMSSSKNSEQSEINLEIFTKTKFTRESREEMERSFKNERRDASPPRRDASPPKDHFAKRQTSTNGFPPPKELLKVKNSEAPGINSLKSSREKKKLSLATRELENLRREEIQGQRQDENKPLGKLSKAEVSEETRSSREKESQPGRGVDHLVPYQEHAQYFSFIPTEDYKFSYVCRHLLIFKSPFLTVERTAAHDPDHPTRLTLTFTLTTHKYIPDFEFSVEEQECIRVEREPETLPPNLPSDCQFRIEVSGEMRKVPLRLPTIALFIRKKMFFEYILPFTLNLLLRPAPPETALAQYQRLAKEPNRRCHSPALLPSKALLPQRNFAYLPQLLPGCSLLPDSPPDLERHLWLGSYGKLAFLFVLEVTGSKTLVVRGMDVGRRDDYNTGMLRYAVNLLAHLLAEREA